MDFPTTRPETLTVHIPMTFQRHRGWKLIITPETIEAWTPPQPQPDETLIRARARARAQRWKRLLEDGTYRSAAELAEAEKISRSFVNRLLRLTLLAPDIVEAILDRRQRRGMTVPELTRAVPSAWTEQRNLIGILHPFLA